MRRDHVNYTVVGMAVLAALALLLFALVAVTGRRGVTTDYFVTYRNVTGLAAGAPVNYEGFRIGQVDEIEPSRGSDGVRYRVKLDVRADWPVPEDSVATLESTGLLADVAIGIKEGKSQTMLDPGDEITGAEGADMFAAVGTLADELTALSRDELRPLVQRLGGRLDNIAAELEAAAPELLSQSDELLGRLNRAAEGIEAITGQPNQQNIEAVLRDLRAVAGGLEATRKEADDMLKELRGTIAENRPDIRSAVIELDQTMASSSQRIDAVLANIESASRNFDQFTRELRRNPNRLLISPPADEGVR